MHHGLADQRVAVRATVLATAYATHPERFPAGLPHPPARPVIEVWINPPKTRATEESRGLAASRGGVLDHARPRQLLLAHRSDLPYAGFWAEYEVGVPPKLSWMGARHDRQAVRRLRSVLDEDLDDPLPRRVTTGVIHARAWRLIHGHWRDVKRVAQALLAHDTLTGEALVDLLPGLVPTTRFDNDGHLVVAAIRSNLEPLTPREKRRNLTPTPEARAQAEEPIPQPPTY